MSHTFAEPNAKPIKSEIGLAFASLLKGEADLKQLDFLRNVLLLESLMYAESEHIKRFVLKYNFNFPDYRDEVVNVLRAYAESHVSQLRVGTELDPEFNVVDHIGYAGNFLADLSNRQRIGNAFTALLEGIATPEQKDLLAKKLKVNAILHTGSGHTNEPKEFSLQFKPREIGERSAVFEALQESAANDNTIIISLSNRNKIFFGLRAGQAKEFFTGLYEQQLHTRGIE